MRKRTFPYIEFDFSISLMHVVTIYYKKYFMNSELFHLFFHKRICHYVIVHKLALKFFSNCDLANEISVVDKFTTIQGLM